jgi:hypothetical protein
MNHILFVQSLGRLLPAFVAILLLLLLLLSRAYV